MEKEIIVSIQCITYNHALYIREALDSFLMQETNFRYEIVVHDDASTDGTADIIREDQEQYPDVIVPILQKENQYSRHVDLNGIIRPYLRGKYIAYCEGDDYWTDPHKLQLQFDYMETHPQCAMYIHNAYERDDRDPKERLVERRWSVPTGDYTLDDYLAFLTEGQTIGGTATYFVRKDMLVLNKYADKFSFGDFFMLLSLQHGYMHYSDACMAAYRTHNPGSYNSVRNALPFLERIEKWQTYYLELLLAAEYLNMQLDFRHSESIRKFQKWILKRPLFELQKEVYFRTSSIFRVILHTLRAKPYMEPLAEKVKRLIR